MCLCRKGRCVRIPHGAQRRYGDSSSQPSHEEEGVGRMVITNDTPNKLHHLQSLFQTTHRSSSLVHFCSTLLLLQPLSSPPLSSPSLICHSLFYYLWYYLQLFHLPFLAAFCAVTCRSIKASNKAVAVRGGPDPPTQPRTQI